MKRQIKKFIIPTIVIGLFIIIYFFIYPIYKLDKATKTIFKDFENGLTNFKVEYKKEELDASEYGAKKAYSYTANEKLLMLYVFPKNSSKFNEGLKNGYIVSKKNDKSKLYGIFLNNCVLLIESEYPNNEQVLSLFNSLSEEYNSNL